MPTKVGRKPRSAEQLQETRAKIIAKAQALFQQEGYESVSIRRLAKEVGCAPMTIYAHFDSKIHILQYLWSDVLRIVFDEIQVKLENEHNPKTRLMIAAQHFVYYWMENPDHFRLVFMSSDITRENVSSFLANSETKAHFSFFTKLVNAANIQKKTINVRTDTLITSLIGLAFCQNTMKDYAWSNTQEMVELTVNQVTN